jgi:uncharacterized protein (TIGR03083 family)
VKDLPTMRFALELSYGAMEALTVELSEEEWETPSLCPGWTARDVVLHLASIEQVLAGWLPGNSEEPPDFARAGRFATETAVLDNATFERRVREVFTRRRSDLAELVRADLERPSWTPIGPATYGRFLELRVFDFWVHERDITTPLGRLTDNHGLCAEMTLDEVQGSLGYIVGKKVGLPDGHSIAFHLTGPLERDLYVVVEGRAKVVEYLEHPDVELTTDSLTFVQLAAGRIDPDLLIEDGVVRWTGDAELGGLAARNLAFTM